MSFDDHDDRREVMCGSCDGHGVKDCYCGGDLCVCGQQEYDCPRCDGAGYVMERS